MSTQAVVTFVVNVKGASGSRNVRAAIDDMVAAMHAQTETIGDHGLEYEVVTTGVAVGPLT